MLHTNMNNGDCTMLYGAIHALSNIFERKKIIMIPDISDHTYRPIYRIDLQKYRYPSTGKAHGGGASKQNLKGAGAESGNTAAGGKADRGFPSPSLVLAGNGLRPGELHFFRYHAGLRPKRVELHSLLLQAGMCRRRCLAPLLYLTILALCMASSSVWTVKIRLSSSSLQSR